MYVFVDYLHMSLCAFTFQLYSPLLTSSKNMFLFLNENKKSSYMHVSYIKSTRGRCYLKETRCKLCTDTGYSM